MHIAFVIPVLHGSGAERAIVGIANAVAEQGVEVSVVTFADPTPGDYDLHPRIQRYGLGSPSRWHVAPVILLRALRRVWALRRLFRRIAPDATVAFLRSSTILTTIAGLGLDHVRIGSIRTHPTPALPFTRLEALGHRLTFPRMHAVVVRAEPTRQCVQRPFPGVRVEVIPNLVSLVSMAPRETAPRSGQHRHILAAGRLMPQKGFDVLLEAAAIVLPEHPEARLTILGEGPERPALEAQVQRLGLRCVVQLPWRRDDIADWYASADVFVLSSRFAGFPNVLVDAMAAGVAVISTDCPTGPGDIVTDGVDGILVPVEDARALASAMDGPLRDPARCQRVGEEANREAERYDREPIAQRWIGLIEEADR